MPTSQINPLYDRESGEQGLFRGSPSQWINFKKFVLCAVFAAVGVFLVSLSPSWVNWVGWIVLVSAGVVAVAAYIDVHFTRYLITSERIELEKGWLSKKIDHLDLFRVEDVQYAQSIPQRIVGIGTMTVYSNDTSHPVLKLACLRGSREAYDHLKREAVRADRRRGVLHVES